MPITFRYDTPADITGSLAIQSGRAKGMDALRKEQQAANQRMALQQQELAFRAKQSAADRELRTQQAELDRSLRVSESGLARQHAATMQEKQYDFAARNQRQAEMDRWAQKSDYEKNKLRQRQGEYHKQLEQLDKAVLDGKLKPNSWAYEQARIQLDQRYGDVADVRIPSPNEELIATAPKTLFNGKEYYIPLDPKTGLPNMAGVQEENRADLRLDLEKERIQVQREQQVEKTKQAQQKAIYDQKKFELDQAAKKAKTVADVQKHKAALVKQKMDLMMEMSKQANEYVKNSLGEREEGSGWTEAEAKESQAKIDSRRREVEGQFLLRLQTENAPYLKAIDEAIADANLMSQASAYQSMPQQAPQATTAQQQPQVLPQQAQRQQAINMAIQKMDDTAKNQWKALDAQAKAGDPAAKMDLARLLSDHGIITDEMYQKAAQEYMAYMKQ
jgi:hypothetical protein